MACTLSVSRATVAWRSGALALPKLLPGLVIAVACLLLLWTAPTDHDTWWQDAPRHALNGIFLRDFLAAAPWRDPVGYAVQYYLRYPSLTVMFYPPLFYLFEAAAFALFGFSALVAQATVTAFYFLLGLGTYRLARIWLGRPEALGAALLLIGTPEIAYWGRQIMLDIPSGAALVWGVWFFHRYSQTGRTRPLLAAAALLIAAIYIKYNAFFVAPALLLALLQARGWRGFADRRLWLVALGSIVLLIPAAVMMLKFGQANLQSVVGRPGDAAIDSLAAWIDYPSQLPSMMGWPFLILALAGGALALARKLRLPHWALLAAWMAAGYLIFSTIGVREPRHFLMVLPPAAILATLAVRSVVPTGWSGRLALALGIGTFGYSLILDPPPYLTGYRAAADYVATTAPKDGIVLFSGNRDGAFVFDIRGEPGRGDLSVLRADKLLLRIAVERSRGVGETSYSNQQILELLQKLGVGIVVAQDDFWEDLDQMKRLAEVLHSSAFLPVAHFGIGGPVGHDDKAVTIYRPTYAVTPPQIDVTIAMPMAGGDFHGKLGK